MGAPAKGNFFNRVDSLMRRLFTIFRLRLRTLFSRKTLDQELDEELCYHLERQIDAEVERGVTPQDARYAALRSIRDIEQRKEECRDMRRVNFAGNLILDLRYAVRMLRNAPIFTVVAVLSLALGTGANTAVFNLIDSVLLSSLPVHNPQRLVLISKRPSQPLSYPLYKFIRDHNEVLSGVIAFHAFANWNVNTIGETELMTGQLVSGNYFRVLGIKAAAGRLLSPEDDQVLGGHPVAVISFSLWRRRFASDRDAIGKTIRIYGHTFTIVGVTPPEFFGTQAGLMPEITIPLMMQSSVLPIGSLLQDSSDTSWLYVMGRLRHGISKRQAAANFRVLFQHFMAARLGPGITPEERSELMKQNLELASGSQGLNQLRRQFSFPLRILMAVAALILLIACVNLANLLLARASARQREIAIRLAIGAGRFRLVRQLLTESLLLAFMGAALGLVFAHYADAILVRFFAIQIEVSPNSQVLGFCAVLCLLTSMLFGLAPALSATRADLTTPLKQTRGGARTRRLDRYLMITQVSFSLLLVVIATLFVRSLQNLENLDAGFNRKDVLLVPVNPTFAGYKGDRLADLYKELLAKVGAIPGVRSATLVTDIPVNDLSWFQSFTGTDPTIRPEQVSINHVGARFFETFGIPILKGRDFTAHDDETAPKVIGISEALARHYFPHHDAIGKITELGTIVAVVKDVKYGSLRASKSFVVYRPLLQEPSSWGGTTIAVRMTGNVSRRARSVRRAVHEIDPTLPILDITTMVETVNESLRQERLFAALTSVFGLLALALVSIGLYGIVGYAASRRTNEIGIRMALGATRVSVLWLIIHDVFALVGSGIVIGLLLAFVIDRWIASLLFGISPVDFASLAFSILIFLVVAAISGFLPARYTSRVDAAAALRFE